MGKCVMAGQKCPATNDRNAKYFCPAWQPSIWTNPQGEEKIINCVFEAQHLATVEVIRACNNPISMMEVTRDEIVKGFEKLNMLAAARVAQAMIEE